MRWAVTAVACIIVALVTAVFTAIGVLAIEGFFEDLKGSPGLGALIGSVVGFLALTAAVTLAAYYNRRQGHRDHENALKLEKDRRDAEAKTARKEQKRQTAVLVASLTAEITSVFTIFGPRIINLCDLDTARPGDLDKLIKEDRLTVPTGASIASGNVRVWIEPDTTVYRAVAGNLCMLGPHPAKCVVIFYSTLSSVQETVSFVLARRTRGVIDESGVGSLVKAHKIAMTIGYAAIEALKRVETSDPEFLPRADAV